MNSDAVSRSKKRGQASRPRLSESDDSQRSRMASVRKLYDWDYETVDWINKNARYVNSSAIDIDREATINASNLKEIKDERPDAKVLSPKLKSKQDIEANLRHAQNKSM